MRIKRYLPKSLFGRALLILLAPVVLLQGVVAVSFVQRHYEGVTRQMAGSVARELNYAIRVVENAADAAAAQSRLDEVSAPLGMTLELMEGESVPADTLRRFYDLTGGAVEETFKTEVSRPLAVDLSDDDRVGASILTDKGVLRAVIERRRMIASNPHQLLVVTGVTSVVLLTIALMFLRNQVRPIRELAAAADAFGKGRSEAFRPAGADEVRRAGAAFLAMRARIERQIESRTRMLSSVSHDLRTPLTRMKLSLAMLEGEPEAEEIGRDIRDMERMIEEFLAFARDEAQEESAPVDPAALMEEVAAETRRGGGRVETRVVCAAESATGETPMRRGGVKRALGNLVENAVAYGTHAAVTLVLGPSSIEFQVEDDGPGIPEGAREAALRPFARLDVARNQDRGGGVGLGLAIAAEVARAHGGQLTLGESPTLGGALARLRLPR